MNETLIYTVIFLSSLGIVAAVILYVVAQKFKVIEDPRIDAVEDALPKTNCGGCGFPGCRAFAEACVKADDFSNLNCPVGGNDTMQSVGGILGKHIEEKEPYIAVVRCSGSFEYRKKTNVYDGASSCTIAASLYGGDTGCAYGCLGLGECVDACDFEAMYMDEKTGLPVVIEDKCTACNACVKACPKDIMQLWPKGKKNRRIYVACVNEDKAGPARKSCAVACIGCSKCFDECKYEAITIENVLAYIDYEKCKLCRKCVDVCPTNSIHEINFPPKKEKPAKKESTVASTDGSFVTTVDVVEMIKENTARPKKPSPIRKPQPEKTEGSESNGDLKPDKENGADQ
jgi:Na+-translocating ferredoxin:NAD+ oxidoreductase subunit B